MTNLPSTHPDAQFALATGELSVQRTNHSFSKVAVDQAIEQTVNRDSKTSGGIIGISTNPSATQRWILTAYDRAAFTSCCRDLAGIVPDKYATRKEEAQTRIARDERDVRSLLSTLDNWINPFRSEDEQLTSISLGVQAPPDLQVDLLTVYDKGHKACEDFIKSRLVDGTTSFYASLSKLKLKTLKSVVEKKKVKTESRIIKLRADKALFARLTVLAQKRSLDMAEVMKYPLGPIPWSIAAVDGSLVKTNKSKLLELLESGTDPLEEIPAAAWAVELCFKLSRVSHQPLPTWRE